MQLFGRHSGADHRIRSKGTSRMRDHDLCCHRKAKARVETDVSDRTLFAAISEKTGVPKSRVPHFFWLLVVFRSRGGG
jgi:hypothetical protein